MSVLPLALLLILANASAFPETQLDHALSEERLVTGSIVDAIEALSKQIQDAGLDPLIIDRAEVKYTIPLSLELEAFVDSLKFTGLSNIAINRLDYSVILSRLRFDISLPEIYLSVGDSGVGVTLFRKQIQGNCNGQLSIKNIRITGEVRINISVISGISVRSLSLNFSLGGIDSQLNLIILNRDYSDIINRILNDTIPDFIETNKTQINELLEKIAWEIIAIVL